MPGAVVGLFFLVFPLSPLSVAYAVSLAVAYLGNSKALAKKQHDRFLLCFRIGHKDNLARGEWCVSLPNRVRCMFIPIIRKKFAFGRGALILTACICSPSPRDGAGFPVALKYAPQWSKMLEPSGAIAPSVFGLVHNGVNKPRVNPAESMTRLERENYWRMCAIVY